MKSMQRKFGGLMKRTEDQADVGTVLSDFKAVEEMLERLLKDFKAWQDSWEDILRFQYDATEAFTTLYKPVEPVNDPEMRHQPAETPQKYMSKCIGLQKVYSELRNELQQEIGMIESKLVRPAEEAKQALKPLKGTIKYRENMKRDYERYQSRAEHAQRKETRSAKEEAALSKYESDLAQAQIGYQSADDQVKETFPPVTAAIKTLLPCLLASQIRIQTVLVGQLYTVLDEYTRRHGLPNPAPSEAQIISKWEQEFTSFRMELEGGISVIANGKAVGLPMTLPAEPSGSTITGLGLRNKVMARKPGGHGSLPSLPSMSWHKNTDSTQPAQEPVREEEEQAPPKPPRPGGMSSPAMPSPSIPTSSKPRMAAGSPSSQLPPAYSAPNSATHSTHYDQKSPALTPDVHNPWADQHSSGGATPPYRHSNPINGAATPTFNASQDYFANQSRQTPAGSPMSAASIAAKKKPPPPVPAKRNPSAQTQYVTALYDFEGQNAGDLAFREGDRIRVVKKTDSTDDWWEGELRGMLGSFPANYVRA